MFSYILSRTKQEMLQASSYDNGVYPYYQGTDYAYEVTVSFNPRIHNKATALAAQKQLVELLQKYLEEFQLEDIVLVIEYQKNGMAHYHCAVETEKEVPSTKRFDITKAFDRQFGRTQFKPIINWEDYRTYLSKDIKRNSTSRDFAHCYYYYK